MTLSFFGLITSYLIMAAIVLFLLLESDWSAARKASLIALLSLFYGIHYETHLAVRGWPVRDALPPRFRLVGAEIQEPNSITGDDGAVYLWVTDMDDHASHTQPRSYSLRYDELLHREVSLALQKISNGQPQMGENKPRIGMQEGRITDQNVIQATPHLSFHDLPVYVLPEK